MGEGRAAFGSEGVSISLALWYKGAFVPMAELDYANPAPRTGERSEKGLPKNVSTKRWSCRSARPSPGSTCLKVTWEVCREKNMNLFPNSLLSRFAAMQVCLPCCPRLGFCSGFFPVGMFPSCRAMAEVACPLPHPAERWREAGGPGKSSLPHGVAAGEQAGGGG